MLNFLEYDYYVIILGVQSKVGISKMKYLRQDLKKQIFGFIVTGCLSTMIMFSLYIFLYKFINYQYAYLIAYCTSVFVLYFMNTFVFKRRISLQTFFQFPLIYIGQYIVSAVFLALLVRLGFSVTFAPLFVVIVLIPFTFILNRLVFSKH
jgi:putative flippase GtrA